MIRMPTKSRPPRPGRRPSAMRRGRLLLALLVGLAAPAGAALTGGEAAEPEAPLFFIEAIVVENLDRFRPGRILSESLLEEGQTYSEAALYDAVYRVKRLPLVLDAEFSLRRGSERGRYELVISVIEARRWLFGVDTAVTAWREPVSIEGLTTTDTTVSESSLVGYRQPVGSHGIFYAAVGGTDGTLQLGYSHNNLFDRNILLSLSVAASDCSEVGETSDSNELGEDGCATEIFDLGLDPTYSTWTLTGDSARVRLNLGLPLGGNHSLRLLSAVRTVDAGFRRPAFRPREGSPFSDRREVEASLSWVYNSQDDSVLPTRGLFVEGGVGLRSLSSERVATVRAELAAVEPVDQESDETRLHLTAAKHWPVGARASLSAGARLSVGRSRLENFPIFDPERGVERVVTDDLEVWDGGVSVGYARFLKQLVNEAPKHAGRRPRWRELRWESSAEVFFAGTSPDFDRPENPLRGWRVGSGLVYRNTWGVFRLRFNYQDVQGA